MGAHAVSKGTGPLEELEAANRRHDASAPASGGRDSRVRSPTEAVKNGGEVGLTYEPRPPQPGAQRRRATATRWPAPPPAPRRRFELRRSIHHKGKGRPKCARARIGSAISRTARRFDHSPRARSLCSSETD